MDPLANPHYERAIFNLVDDFQSIIKRISSFQFLFMLESCLISRA